MNNNVRDENLQGFQNLEGLDDMKSYFHLFNRGVNGANIYYEKDNYIFFLDRLKKCKDKYDISILCYCLMPNHFHLFVKESSNQDSIGYMIGDLTNSYTKAINKKYNRTGVLFGGRTKKKIILYGCSNIFC